METKRRRRWPWVIAGIILAFAGAIVVALTVPLVGDFELVDKSTFTPTWALPEREITVVTYNIEFSRRLDDALALVKAQNPDVVCLQVIRLELMPKIERELGMSGAWIGQYGSSEWGNAVLAKGRVTEAQSIPSARGGSFGAWAAVEIDGARFVVGSVHLLHAKSLTGGFAARERQVRSIGAAVCDIGAPVIIAGDFNTPPVGTNYQIMTAAMEDVGVGTGATLPSSYPLVRADYVFASREWQGLSARTLTSRISDHQPVVALLKKC